MSIKQFFKLFGLILVLSLFVGCNSNQNPVSFEDSVSRVTYTTEEKSDANDLPAKETGSQTKTESTIIITNEEEKPVSNINTSDNGDDKMENSKGYGNILLLGDSYTAYEGLVPQGYEISYPSEAHNITTAKDMWWTQILQQTDTTLALNSSFSGTTFCNIGYNGDDVTHKSFITRLDNLIDEGFFSDNQIDTLFIFGGTNDSWANSPIGTPIYSDFNKKQLDNSLPAFSYLLNKAKNNTNVKRICVIINSELKPEITEGMVEISEHYGVEYVRLTNISKLNGHPDKVGMAQIADQVMQKFQPVNQ